MDSIVKNYYQIAINSTGDAYLEAEQKLIAEGESIVLFLQAQLSGLPPIPRLITELILAWINDDETFQACLTYFDQVEQRASQTPVGNPRTDGVANYLIQNFGESVASLLGVYILKLENFWPAWKILGSILYLGRLDSTVSADFLVQFVVQTRNERYREVAVEALVKIGDQSLISKINTALEPLQAAQSALIQARDQIQGSSTS